MAQTVVMPKLGLTMTEGTLVKWHVAEGDTVKIGAPLFDVETDKLTNTVDALAEGTLLKITVQEGDTVPCLEPVGYLGQPGEVIDSATTAAPAASPAAVEAPKPAAAAADTPAASGDGRILAAPAAKKLAKERGIDLSLITPTGPGGRIVLADVESYIASPEPKASGLAKKIAADKGVDLAEVSTGGRVMADDVLSFDLKRSQAELEERVKMNGMRKTIAKRMRESRDISPSVSFNIGVDMTAMKALKADLAAEGLKVSYTDLLTKIVAKLLLEFPAFNSSVDGTDIIYKRYVNMGVAVAVPAGLLVPVVKNAHLLSLAEISAEIKRLADMAKSGTLNPDALTGGTFTITNLGTYGIESFSPIINQPEVAILGVNGMKDSVVAVNGEVKILPIMGLSLVADHRVIDGAVAGEFLAKLKRTMEKPALLLL